MIRSFKNRSLASFWHAGNAARIRPDLIQRLRTRLDALNAARVPEDMNVPGFNFHKLRGKPTRYTVHINGPWCLTFEWDGEDVIRLDLEQYH